MSKNCKNCGSENENKLLKYCKACYPKYGKQLNKSKINPISQKRKERLSGFSEKDLFRQILIKRQLNGYLTCEVCKKKFKIEDAGVYTFAHILPKGKYGAFRLLENNIGIVCSIEHHNEFDRLVKQYKDKFGLKQLELDIASGKKINLNL